MEGVTRSPHVLLASDSVFCSEVVSSFPPVEMPIELATPPIVMPGNGANAPSSTPLHAPALLPTQLPRGHVGAAFEERLCGGNSKGFAYHMLEVGKILPQEHAS